MAKAKKEEEKEKGFQGDPIEEITVSGGLSNQAKEIIKEEVAVETKPTKVISKEVNAAEEVVVNLDEKKVRIHAIESNDCIIAGMPYCLKKDKDYVVPSDVAAILCFGGKAYRL